MTETLLCINQFPWIMACTLAWKLKELSKLEMQHLKNLCLFQTPSVYSDNRERTLQHTLQR